MCVCIELHITAQPGPVLSSVPLRGISVYVCIELHLTAQSGPFLLYSVSHLRWPLKDLGDWVGDWRFLGHMFLDSAEAGLG